MNDPKNESIPPEVAKEIFILCKVVFESNNRPGQILRLHALTEWYIDRLLSILLRHPEFVLNGSNFTYNQKLRVLQSLNGLPECVVDALRRLSRLRNDCAHSMYPIISDEQIYYAAQPIEKEFKLTLQDQENDGSKMDIFHAYVWSVFYELSIAVAPIEKVVDEINSNKV